MTTHVFCILLTLIHSFVNSPILLINIDRMPFMCLTPLASGAMMMYNPYLRLIKVERVREKNMHIIKVVSKTP